MRTVSRKLPTISATATIMPVASDSAALAIEVRRSDAGSDARGEFADDAERARSGAAKRADAAARCRREQREAGHDEEHGDVAGDGDAAYGRRASIAPRRDEADDGAAIAASAPRAGARPRCRAS